MTKKVIILFMILLPLIAYSQNKEYKQLNWIFVVDNAIPDSEFGVIGMSEMIVFYENQKTDTITVDIVPGSMGILVSDYDSIKNRDNISRIILEIKYIENCCNDYLHYEIPIYKAWFDFYYVIVYIYNTDKKENKKYYIPLEGKNYNYQISFSGSGVRLIQKKATKKQKRCYKCKRRWQ
jgi:hypothetical protein